MTETKKKKEKFYTLRHDKAVKTVLINEKYKPVVSKILSDILEEPVTILEFLLNELPSNNFHSKSNRLDVIAKLTDGTLINIEVNSSYSRYVKLRNLLFYTAMYSQLVEVGNDNYSEVKTIQVNLNFEMGDNKGLKRRSKIRYEDTNEIYDDSFEIIDVNIDKYKKLWYHENINLKFCSKNE